VEQQDKDWQPESDEQVLNIVDPSLFPLVYGRSLVLEDGGQVDLDDIFGCYEQAKVASKHVDRRVDSLKVQKQIEKGLNHPLSLSIHHSKREFYYWSFNFQWLPCEVEFSGTSVQTFILPLILTTYILLTNRYTEVSRSLFRWPSNHGMIVLSKGSMTLGMERIEHSEVLSLYGL